MNKSFQEILEIPARGKEFWMNSPVLFTAVKSALPGHGLVLFCTACF